MNTIPENIYFIKNFNGGNIIHIKYGPIKDYTPLHKIHIIREII